MPEWLKNILQHESEELKQNKIRAIAIGVCFIVVLIVWLTDNTSDGEEIILNEPITPVETPPATKDLPVKILPAEKSSDGVTLVLGANADELIIGDPFAAKEKPKPPKIATPPVPPIVIQPPPSQPPAPTKPQEKIILTGTAISGDKKTAMFLREKETVFLSIGDEIGGKKISDIKPDFVTFEDNARVFIQKELR